MRYLLVIIGWSMWISVSVADICSHLPGYSNHESSCYKLHTSKKTWANAEASCVADGGHLASIHSTAEMEFIQALVASSSNIWMGLSGTPPNKAWSDETGIDYELWCTDEPNTGDPWCGRMKSSCSFQWTDRSCSDTDVYVCKVDELSSVTTSPETPTTEGTSSKQDLVQMQGCFTKIQTDVSVDATALPSSGQIVRSIIECALKCHQDVQCEHFITTEKESKYLCETYTSMMRPPTANPPRNDYQKINC